MTEEEIAEGIEKILDRIPERWGKGIYAPAEWFPILVELDRDIAKLHPEYAVHQVKEKFGGLRYYTDHDGCPEVDDLIRKAEIAVDKLEGRLLDEA